MFRKRMAWIAAGVFVSCLIAFVGVVIVTSNRQPDDPSGRSHAPPASVEPPPEGLTFRGQDGDMFFAVNEATYFIDAQNRLTIRVYCHANDKHDYMATPRVELERFPLDGPLTPGLIIRHSNQGEEDRVKPWASMYIGIHTEPRNLTVEFESQTTDGWWVSITFGSEDVTYYDGRAKPQKNFGRCLVRRVVPK